MTDSPSRFPIRPSMIHRRSPARPFAGRTLAVVMLLLAMGLSQPARGQLVQVAEGKQGMVVASHELAAKAGITILKEGGNAVDAAVAVALTLGVTEPFGSGLGGKLVLLYYDASTHRVTYIQAMDEGSHSLDPAAVRALPVRQRDQDATSVCVPGMLSGWSKAHEMWGKLAWAKLCQPAIDAASKGYVVPEGYVRATVPKEQLLREHPQAAAIFLPDGKLPQIGQTMTNSDLAKSLTLIQQQGAAALYGGELGRKMADCIRSNGGWMTLDDLRSYQPHVSPASVAAYRGMQVYSSGGPAVGGATVLAALACLDGLDPAGGPAGEQRIDQMARILSSVYPATNDLADDAESDRLFRRLLQPSQINALRREAMSAAMGPVSANVYEQPTELEASRSTTHFVVVDSRGNVVTATQSLGYHYGSGVVIPGTGILMNNSMNNFTNNSKSHNFFAPGRRPRSTMSPTLLVKDGKPYLALGAPGGQRIPTAVLQVVTGVVDYHLTLPQAVEQARFHTHNTHNGKTRTIDLEDSTPAALEQKLQQDGWNTNRIQPPTVYFGGVNAVMFLPDGTLQGVADLRRSNVAEGM